MPKLKFLQRTTIIRNGSFLVNHSLMPKKHGIDWVFQHIVIVLKDELVVNQRAIPAHEHSQNMMMRKIYDHGAIETHIV